MKIRTAITVLALALPLAAQAEFDYSYLEGGYVRIEPDNFDDSGDGIGARGSFAISNNLFILGEVTSTELDDVDVDFDTYSLGLGVHVPLSNNIDVVGSASWANAEVEVETPVGGFSADDDGARLDLGLRGWISPAFELNGGIRYTSFDDDETSGYLRGLFGESALRLLVEVEAGDEGEIYLIGGRYDF